MNLVSYSVAAVAILLSGNALAQGDTRVFPAAAIKQLKVDNENGSTIINGADVSDIKITAVHRGKTANCKFETKLDGDELEVEAEDKSWLGEGCTTDITIEVPRALSLDLETESGELRVNGVKSAVEADIGSGKLSAKDNEFSVIDVEVKSGSVDIDSIVTNGQFKVGSGLFDLKMSQVPAAGHINVDVKSGKGTIAVPESARILSSGQVGSGTFLSDIESVADATYRISMTAKSGMLAIKKL